MIASLRGKLLQIKAFEAVIECAGVGYKAQITLSAMEELNRAGTGSEVFLHVHTVTRDTGITLYGFADAKELSLFEFLLSLQGIGPKNALNLISHIGKEELVKALFEENGETITKTPGVGAAKAKKILFEAQQKKKKLKEISATVETAQRAPEGEEILEAVTEALQSLGFQIREIEKTKARIPREEFPAPDYEKLQDWIRLFLKYL